MTHLYITYFFIFHTTRLYVHVSHDLFVYVTWRHGSYICDKTHLYMTHFFWLVIWLVHMSICDTTWFLHVCDWTCRLLGRDMVRLYMWHDSSTYVMWLGDMCNMTRRYVWHESATCVTWLVDACDMTHGCVWHDSSTCATWLIDMCDVTRRYVWHDSSTCVTGFATWLMDACDITHGCVRHNSSTCATWLIDMCDVTRRHAWHDTWMRATWNMESSTCATWLKTWLVDAHVGHDSATCATWLKQTLHVAHVDDSIFHVARVHESCRTCRRVMSHMCVHESCRTCRRVMSPSHEKCHTCWRVMSHMSMSHRHVASTSHVAHVAESCPQTCRWLIDMCDMTRRHVWHFSSIYVIWLIYICHDSCTCDMTHQYVWHGPASIQTWAWCVGESVCVCVCVCLSTHHRKQACLVHDFVPHVDESCRTSHMSTSHVAHVHETCLTPVIFHILTCMTWLIYMCGMTHVYVWHDSSIRVTWRNLHKNVDVAKNVRKMAWLVYDSCMCVTRIHGCGMTHP